jgi:hypothetical protein
MPNATVPRTFFYFMENDTMFAPNPLGGVLSLATCKPDIRGPAKVNDIIIGVAGDDLLGKSENLRVVYMAKVTEKISHKEYSEKCAKEPELAKVKIPSENAKHGDCILDYTPGAPCLVRKYVHSIQAVKRGPGGFKEVEKDLKASVLLSTDFKYFGANYITVGPLEQYTDKTNRRGCIRLDIDKKRKLNPGNNLLIQKINDSAAPLDPTPLQQKTLVSLNYTEPFSESDISQLNAMAKGIPRETETTPIPSGIHIRLPTAPAEGANKVAKPARTELILSGSLPQHQLPAPEAPKDVQVTKQSPRGVKK